MEKDIKEIKERVKKRLKKIDMRLLEMEEVINVLKWELKKIKEKSNIDPLTKVYNRGYILHALKRMIENYQKFKVPFSIFMLDIDHFKKINDTYGHLYGDKVLEFVGKVLKSNLREEDKIGRYGGEEFLVILSFSKKEEGIKVAERIRKIIEEKGKKLKCSLTVSIGVANIEELEEKDRNNMLKLIELADSRLYVAKKTGRNKVVGG